MDVVAAHTCPAAIPHFLSIFLNKVSEFVLHASDFTRPRRWSGLCEIALQTVVEHWSIHQEQRPARVNARVVTASEAGHGSSAAVQLKHWYAFCS